MLRQSIARTARPLASSSFFTSSMRVPAAARQSQKVPAQGMTILKAGGGMPQLVPFFFVNETVTAFGVIAGLVYFGSKYVLPRFVRMNAARLFITKMKGGN